MTDAQAVSIPARRILLVVTGLTPQVVTETLYALACAPAEGADAWIPHEIHLVTTSTGAENARLNLLDGEGWFHRLCVDYKLPVIAFPEEHIHVLEGTEGEKLDDIRSPQHNACAADFITELVRRLTESDDTELHVSIAGGRKTMGYYLGYAMSLFGRQRDRLSHVLVSEPYETNRDFYYPTPYAHPIHVRRGDREITVDARNARVDLASIPFVRLRDDLSGHLLSGSASFNEVIARANRGLEPPLLRLRLDGFEVYADELKVPLSETEFALLLWLARRTQRGVEPQVLEAADEADEFLLECKRLFGGMSTRFETIESALKDAHGDRELILGYFQTPKSRLKSKFIETLGRRPAVRYQIGALRSRSGLGYYLPLESEQIRVEE